jgi:hypothetical protein
MNSGASQASGTCSPLLRHSGCFATRCQSAAATASAFDRDQLAANWINGLEIGDAQDCSLTLNYVDL